MEEVHLAVSKMEGADALQTVQEDNLDLWDQLTYYDPAVHSPISELPHVLDDDDGYIPSPNADDASNLFFEDFLDIDKLIATYDHTSDLYNELDTLEVADEKMIADDLQLTEEEKELTDFIISSFDNDSTEAIDDLLSGIKHEENPGENNLGDTQETVFFPHVKEGTDLDVLSELLTENDITINEETMNTSKLSEENIVVTDVKVLNTSELFNTHYDDLHKDISVDASEEILNEIVKTLNAYEDVLKNCEVVPHENSLEHLVTPTLTNTVNKDFLVYGQTTNDQTQLHSINTLKRKHASMGDFPSKNSNSDTIRSHSASVGSEDIDLGDMSRKDIRRYKNNEASKITRAKRKCKHDDLFRKEDKLLKSNAMLRTKLEVMQREADIIRELLVVALREK